VWSKSADGDVAITDSFEGGALSSPKISSLDISAFDMPTFSRRETV
jgi:hypothetical protein